MHVLVPQVRRDGLGDVNIELFGSLYIEMGLLVVTLEFFALVPFFSILFTALALV
jgi:hypothetical protein